MYVAMLEHILSDKLIKKNNKFGKNAREYIKDNTHSLQMIISNQHSSGKTKKKCCDCTHALSQCGVCWKNKVTKNEKYFLLFLAKVILQHPTECAKSHGTHSS